MGPYRAAADKFRLDAGRPPNLFGAWLNSFPLAIGARMFSAFLDTYSRGAASAGAGAGAGAAPAGPVDGRSDRGAGWPADARTKGGAGGRGAAPRS